MHYTDIKADIKELDKAKQNHRHYSQNRDYDMARIWLTAVKDIEKSLETDIAYFNQLILNDWHKRASWESKLDLLKIAGLVNLKQRDDQTEVFVSQNAYNPFWNQLKHLRWWVYYRDNSICQYCLKTVNKDNSHVDHVIPVSAFPKEFLWLANDPTNLVAACQDCNLSKSNKLQWPKTSAAAIALDSCQPRMNDLIENCLLKTDYDNCPKCGWDSLQVMCNVHGFIKAFSCQLSAKSGCDLVGV